MDKEELQARSFRFSVAMRQLCCRVRAVVDGRNVGEQLLDCSTSMAANYRAACRARSRAEFISKLGTVSEESDEAVYWLEFIAAGGFIPVLELAAHLDEARQLRAIFGASYGTARANYQRQLAEQRLRAARRRK